MVGCSFFLESENISLMSCLAFAIEWHRRKQKQILFQIARTLGEKCERSMEHVLQSMETMEDLWADISG